MAEDCGPWLEKKLEIGKYSKPNKLCGLCEVRPPAVPPSLLPTPFPRAPPGDSTPPPLPLQRGHMHSEAVRRALAAELTGGPIHA